MRWIHEDCIDNEDVDIENCKLCPLCYVVLKTFRVI